MKLENSIKLAVIGAKGSIGKRYCAIAKALNVNLVEIEVNDIYSDCHFENITHAIICTPTSTHYEACYNIIAENPKIKILLEKPYSSDIGEILKFKELVLEYDIQMVMNYHYTPKVMNQFSNKTIYRNYHSGSDGAHWDCIQLILLAKGEIEINTASPIWECEINGTKITLEDVNRSYVLMVVDFLQNNKRLNQTEILIGHEKLHGRLQNERTNSNSSKNNLD